MGLACGRHPDPPVRDCQPVAARQYVTYRHGSSMIGRVMNAASPVTEVLGRLLVGIDHVGIAVSDLDTAVAMWAMLGWRETHRETNDEQGVHEVMLSAPGGGPQMQLLASAREDSAIARFLTKRGPGLQQVAFEVTDVQAAIDACLRAGLEVLHPQPQRGTAGRQISFIHPNSCGGVLVELIGPANP